MVEGRVASAEDDAASHTGDELQVVQPGSASEDRELHDQYGETAAHAEAYWTELCQECAVPLEEQILLDDDEDVESECELAASFRGSSRNELLKRMAEDPKHLLLHEPKNPFCLWCQRANGTRRRRTRKKPGDKLKVVGPGYDPFCHELRMDPLMENDARLQGFGLNGVKVNWGLCSSTVGAQLSSVCVLSKVRVQRTWRRPLEASREETTLVMLTQTNVRRWPRA